MISEHLLDLLLLQLADVLDTHFVFGFLRLFGLEQVIETLLVRFNFLVLILDARFQSKQVVFHQLRLSLVVHAF